jgi:hypothetical protein
MQAAQQAAAEVTALKDRYESLVLQCITDGGLYVSSLQHLHAEAQKLRAIHPTDKLSIDAQDKVVALHTHAVDTLYETCTLSFDSLLNIQTDFAQLKQSTQREIDAAIDTSTVQSERTDLVYLLVKVKQTRVQSSHLENVVRQMNFIEH